MKIAIIILIIQVFTGETIRIILPYYWQINITQNYNEIEKVNNAILYCRNVPVLSQIVLFMLFLIIITAK